MNNLEGNQLKHTDHVPSLVKGHLGCPSLDLWPLNTEIHKHNFQLYYIAIQFSKGELSMHSVWNVKSVFWISLE